MKRLRKKYWYIMHMRPTRNLNPIDYLLVMLKGINTEQRFIFKYLGRSAKHKQMRFKVLGQRGVAKVDKERFFRMMTVEKLPPLEDVLYNGGRHEPKTKSPSIKPVIHCTNPGCKR